MENNKHRILPKIRFEEEYSKHRKQLERYAAQLSSDNWQDLLQEACLELFKSGAQVHNFLSLMKKIMKTKNEYRIRADDRNRESINDHRRCARIELTEELEDSLAGPGCEPEHKELIEISIRMKDAFKAGKVSEHAYIRAVEVLARTGNIIKELKGVI